MSAYSVVPARFHRPPPSSVWSWVNQGSATVDQSRGPIYLYTPTTGGNSFRCRMKTAPPVPYTITLHMRTMMENPGGENYFVFVWRENATGELVTFGLGDDLGIATVGELSHYKWNSATSFSSSYRTGVPTWGINNWFQVSDDGTSRICRVSADGFNWKQFDSQTRTDFLTADQVGFAVATDGASGWAALTLDSWKEETV
jgi:hypothetical protein